MEMGGSFVDAEVLKFKKSGVNHDDVCNIQAKRDIFTTANEEDVMVKLCEEGEVCLFRTRGVSNNLFYFYLNLLDDFRI